MQSGACSRVSSIAPATRSNSGCLFRCWAQYGRSSGDEKKWTNWALTTPFMRAFRQMLFAKIVPNLRSIGLLTPRIRDAYEKIGILQFEDGKDSTEELMAPPPQDFLKLIGQFVGEEETMKANEVFAN